MEERTETSCDRVGVMDDSVLAVRSRVVRAVVRDPNKSHDEILHPKRRRYFNFGRRYREKKLETSTIVLTPLFWTMNDTTLFDRVSSPSVMIEEMTESRSSTLRQLLR